MTPEAFKQARLSLGLSQGQLAAVMGYSSNQRVSQIERGLRNPSPAAERLLRAYVAGYRPDDWPTD